jgi:integrase
VLSPDDPTSDGLDQCPSVEWKLVVGLARLAGLHCPSEIGALTWDHVNWEKGRLTVLATKTEHHGGDQRWAGSPYLPRAAGAAG